MPDETITTMPSNFQAQVDRVIDTIVRRYQPEKIILFGSAARGEATSDSDVDLLIVKDDHRVRHDRSVAVRKILRNAQYRFPLDVVVYTPHELQERKIIGDFFVNRVLEEGKVLYATS